jgi:hypothetical protein
MALDFPASATALWQIYDQSAIRPEYLLPTLWAESGFDPAIQNRGGAPNYGINQVSASYLATLGISVSDYVAWPASQQLTRVVLPMSKGWPKPLLSGTRVYQANLLPATVNGTAGWTPARYPNDVVVSKAGPTNKNAADYNGNSGIDTGKKGYISVADLEAFVRKTIPSIQSALQSTYALRPTETMQDPVIGTDPYLGPGSPSNLGPGTGTNIVLAVGGSVVVLGAAGLLAWGLTAERYEEARENPIKRCPTGSQVQSLVFSRDKFTTSSARRWAANHGFSAGYVDHKPNSLRIRQRSPEGWRRMRTVSMAPGVRAVVGWKRC